MQAYTQSKTKLNHILIYHLLVKLKKRYPESIFLFIVKSLYDLVEIRNHWFITYLDDIKDKLGMKI